MSHVYRFFPERPCRWWLAIVCLKKHSYPSDFNMSLFEWIKKWMGNDVAWFQSHFALVKNFACLFYARVLGMSMFSNIACIYLYFKCVNKLFSGLKNLFDPANSSNSTLLFMLRFPFSKKRKKTFFKFIHCFLLRFTSILLVNLAKNVGFAAIFTRLDCQYNYYHNCSCSRFILRNKKSSAKSFRPAKLGNFISLATRAYKTRQALFFLYDTEQNILYPCIN